MSKITLPATASSSLLQHSNGHAGVLQWLKVLSNCLISAHLAGHVFLNIPFADLTHADICDKAAAFEQNQHNYTTRHSPNNNSNNNSNNNINTPAKHPAGHKTTTQKNPDNNNRQPANQALSTASTTTSQWTPAHPHTRPPGNGSGPGRSNQPHCTHCAKNGHVFNNHGFEGAAKGPLCHDLARIDPTQTTHQRGTNPSHRPGRTSQRVCRLPRRHAPGHRNRPLCR